MRISSTLAFVISSSVFGFAACSSSSAPLGDDVDAGGTTPDAGSPVDSGSKNDSGSVIVDSGSDTGPVITGDFSCAGATLPTTAPASITVSGTAVDQALSGQTLLEGVAISAYPTQTSTTASSNDTTNAVGAFSLVVGTGELPVDGYLKATLTGEMDTYLYANAPLAKDSAGLDVVMLTPTTYGLLSFGGGVTQDAAKGIVAVAVLDCEAQPVVGATVSSSPAGDIRYGGSAGPSKTATSTDTSGLAYLFNVPTGDVTVSAMAGSTALRTHHIVVRSGAFTTTLITP
jgi:hypothetical protein